MPEVILAGYNIDFELIKELKEKVLKSQKLRDTPASLEQSLDISPEMLTPETLSAAYARISRYPDSVPLLREKARKEVEKARKSNETIIFGLGHSSVAEHAVFNFDILHLSRLAVEFLERFRLASFTEKSQRYITLDGDFVIPPEIQSTPHESPFCQLIEKQNQIYEELRVKLDSYFKKKYPELAETKRGRQTLEGWAKEDARYAISLATESQLGMTVNARTLEYMIARSRSNPLKEIQILGEKLYSAVKDLTPSIIKYPDPTPYFIQTERILAGAHYIFLQNTHTPEEQYDVQWLNPESLNENLIYETFARIMGKKSFEPEDRKLLLQWISEANPWDAMPRLFEMFSVQLEIILSSAAFGQLKRHRMSTQLAQPYDPSLGITIPPSIKEIGEAQKLQKIAQKSSNLYFKLRSDFPFVAPYILTNAHRRRVFIQMNLRELYHFARLRSDEHAQWDIRMISQKISNLLRNKLPLLGILLVGKDQFEHAKNKLKKGINL